MLVVEWQPAAMTPGSSTRDMLDALRTWLGSHASTQCVRHLLVHPGLPVDYRHNAKIQREALARWAAGQLGRAVVK